MAVKQRASINNVCDRRRLLRVAGATILGAGLPAAAASKALALDPKLQNAARPAQGNADHVIRIATGLVELGANTIVSTKLYNGQFPGPLLRMWEGRPVVIDVHNDTDDDEQLHWHGQFLPADVDGATEEGTPIIPARGWRRLRFIPGPAGFRFYHTHVMAGADLAAGLYSGQAGPVYVEPAENKGRYDREVFLTLKEFGPFLTRTEMPNDVIAPAAIVPELQARALADLDAATKRHLPDAYELGYNFYSINGRMLGEGEPIRVTQGERVLFHILNASATEIRSLALTGHAFRILALDGYQVTQNRTLPVLWLAPAERITALVDMNRSGNWVMGDLNDDARTKGMGIIVEYAGAKGVPQWKKPAMAHWDYRLFANRQAAPQKPDETLTLTFTANPAGFNGFDQFMINGIAFDMKKMEPMFKLERSRRYRLRLRNATDDIHPLHLHRHGFELTNIAGTPISGITKDVVMIGGFQEIAVDFVANQPGLSLFHCHMQDHMDFGFMALFNCV
jgi:FtsP/CotA-like multicopper oxidase with cupredoxin domain